MWSFVLTFLAWLTGKIKGVQVQSAAQNQADQDAQHENKHVHNVEHNPDTDGRMQHDLSDGSF